MAGYEQGKTFSRRNVLKVLAGAGIAARVPREALGAVESAHCASSPAGLVNIQSAVTDAPTKFLNADQIRTLTALTEALIPADEHSPGAAAAGVPAYIDAVLERSPEARKTVWTQGLAAIDRMAEREFSARFSECTAATQDQLLLSISANEDNPVKDEERFFVAAKHLTLEGYYNSRIGLDQDLEYQGNTALSEFEGCTHPEHGAPNSGAA